MDDLARQSCEFPRRPSSRGTRNIGGLKLLHLAVIGVCAGASASCDAFGSPEYSIELAEPALTLQLGEIRGAGARLLKDSRAVDEVITYTSSAPTIVSVGADGVLRALTLGNATVTATAQGQSATITVTVIAGDAITVTANAEAVVFDALGDTRQVAAEAKNQFGVVVPATITWRSASDAVATVTAAGLIRSAGRGATQVTASVGSASDVVQVTVSQTITSVVITPASPSVLRAETVQLSVTANDRLGQRVQGATVVWSSDNTNIATVNPDGLARGVGVGTTVIRADATAPAQSAVAAAPAAAVLGSVTLRVDPARVATVRVTPPTMSVIVGTTGQLAAETFDLEGLALPGRTVTWSSSAPAIATVDNNGLVQALALGSATITATSETRTGTSTVTVTPSPVATPTISAAPTPTTVVLTGSAFSGPSSEFHSMSDWQVDEAGGDWSTLLGESGETNVDLTARRITGLTSSSNYQARVRYRSSGAAWSAFSAPVTFTTLAANRAPDTPVLTVVGVTVSAASFDGSPFSDPDLGDSHRTSEWQVDLNAGDFSNPVRRSGETNQNLLTWSVTGLTASTAYKVRVRYRDRNSSIAVDGPGVQFTGADGWSEWSTPVTFLTPATAPPPGALEDAPNRR